MAYWDISTAVYSGNSFYVGDHPTFGISMRFKPDGLIMYILDRYLFNIYQYTLSIAWDITTAVYSGKSFSVKRQDDSPADFSFKPDGSIMYMIGRNTNTVYQYDLSSKKNTPWDISSAKYNRIKLDVSVQITRSGGLFFSPDGTKFYFLDTSSTTHYQYNLSVPWDISSGLYSGKSFRLFDPNTSSRNMTFSPDGTKFYTTSTTDNMVFQYTLSIPWDMSTAVYSGKFFYTGDQDETSYGISFSIIGSEMYILGTVTDTVYQYNIPEGPIIPPKKEASRTGVYSFKTSKI